MSQPSWAEVSESHLSPNTNEDLNTEPNVELDRLVVRLQKEMKIAASRLEFEKAAQLRDRIFQLENAGMT